MTRTVHTLCWAALVFAAPQASLTATLHPKTLAAWDKYVRYTEACIEKELQQDAPRSPTAAGASASEVSITRLHTVDDSGRRITAEDGLIHHWKASTLVPGTKLDDVLRFVQDYDQHHRYFKEVEKSRLVSRDGNTFRIFYRLKRTKVLTVVYNTEHTVVYRRQSPQRASSRSVATKIAELDNPGEANERGKASGDDHGFLWRLNSYWRFEQREGGVWVECESVSLSRGIPAGLGWLIRGYVESVPRESLAGTLTSLRDGVKR